MSKSKTQTQKRNIVAEICLYGTSQIGFGYIAALPDGRMFGDGSPVRDRTATDAIWLAVDDVRGAGADGGQVAIYAPGGERVAYAPLWSVPSYGLLQWEAAPVYEISVAEIVRHSQPAH